MKPLTATPPNNTLKFGGGGFMKKLILILTTILFAQSGWAVSSIDFGPNKELQKRISQEVALLIARDYVVNLGIRAADLDGPSVLEAIVPYYQLLADGSYLFFLEEVSTGCLMNIVVNDNGTIHEEQDLTAQNQWKPVTDTTWFCP